MLNKTAISVLYINYNYKKMKLINSLFIQSVFVGSL